MTVLPIVERELRVASRRWGTYILRLTAATIAIAMAAIIYVASTNVAPATIGRTIFGFLSGFAFLYALLIGVRVTSDCISSEKREGTLGLLFLTDLKGLDIVLGKLVAFGLDSFYALIATLPVLTIPLLLGSITFNEVMRVALSLVSTAIFSVCIGMFVSSISVRERKASAGTFLLVLFFTAGLPLLILIFEAYARMNNDIYVFFALSPGASIVTALSWQSKAFPETIYWLSIASTISYALIATVASSIIVPRVWHDSGKDKKVSGNTGAGGKQSERRKLRQEMLDTSPTYWLASRGHLRALWLWVFIAFVVSVWLWGYYESSSDMLELATSLVIMYFVHGIFKVFVASEAVRIYAEEDKQGALELLLCTPISIGEVLKGQLISLFRYFRWPVLVLLSADLFLVLVGRSVTRSTGDTSDQLTMLFLMISAAFVFDCIALCLVGLWNGLIAPNSRSALVSTMSRILVLPWIIFGLLNLVFGLTDVQIRLNHQIWLWFGLGMMTNVLFGWQAWEQLSGNLRIIAATRFEKPSSRLWRVFGRLYGRIAARSNPAR